VNLEPLHPVEPLPEEPTQQPADSGRYSAFFGGGKN
jgi:hypothetical protein